MNTNMAGFKCVFFQKSLHPCSLDESSLSIGRVNMCSTNADPVKLMIGVTLETVSSALLILRKIISQ